MADDMKSLVEIETGGSRTQIPDIPRAVLEALYNSVTGAKESVETHRRLPSKVDANDIGQLMIKLSQWTEQYSPISISSKIVVTLQSTDDLKGVTKSDFANFESFFRHSTASTEPVDNLSVFFDFMSKNEQNGRISQQSLELNLRGFTHLDRSEATDDKPLGAETSFMRRDGWTCKIAVRYTDYLVARGLVGVVDDWYKSLPTVETGAARGLERWLLRNSIYEELGLVKFCVSVVPLVLSAAITVGFLRSSFDPGWFPKDDVALHVLLGIVLAALFNGAASFLFKKFHSANLYEKVPLLAVTAGDIRRAENFLTMRRKREEKSRFWKNSIIAAYAVGLAVSLTMLLLAK